MPLLTPWLALGVAIGQHGCNGSCEGPSCEDHYPRGVLSAHLGALEGAREAWDDADALWVGEESQGAGWELAGAGDSVAVGQPESGAVSLVGLEGGALVPGTAEWSGSGGTGAALAVGDVEEDGRWDLWVGAPGQELGRGVAALFRNAQTSAGVELSAGDVVIQGLTPGDRLGQSIVQCADLTGDGRAEWLLAAPGLSASPEHPSIPSLAGGVWLVRSDLLGRHVGTVEPTQLGLVWWGGEVGAAAGTAASCDRDLTGDGVVDIAVGAPLDGDDDAGVVYLLEGWRLTSLDDEQRLSSGALAEEADRRLVGPWAHGWLGASLVTADVDGDGAADLVVGAPGHEGGRGRAVLYPGVDLAAGEDLHRVSLSPPLDRAAGDHVGSRLASGDLDGDGVQDLILGVADWRGPGGEHDAGRVSVWLGRPLEEWGLSMELDGDEDLVITGTRPYQGVGGAMIVHDLDGDGVDDLILATRSE